MKPLRRKWAVLAVLLVLIAAGALFLFRAISRLEAPAPPKQPAVQDNPAHELKELEVLLQKKPGHFPVLMRMAQIERDQGNLAAAITHLREAVASEPANANAHLELGRALWEKGDRDEALKETEKALAINPKHVDALYNLGAIQANLGDTKSARLYWQRAIESAPESDSGKKARDGLARLEGGENRRSK